MSTCGTRVPQVLFVQESGTLPAREIARTFGTTRGRRPSRKVEPSASRSPRVSRSDALRYCLDRTELHRRRRVRHRRPAEQRPAQTRAGPGFRHGPAVGLHRVRHLPPPRPPQGMDQPALRTMASRHLLRPTPSSAATPVAPISNPSRRRTAPTTAGYHMALGHAQEPTAFLRSKRAYAVRHDRMLHL
jgi:hypothetical protein